MEEGSTGDTRRNPTVRFEQTAVHRDHTSPVLSTPDTTQRILIVDDITDNLDLLERALRGVGAEIVRAESGEEAIRLAGQQSISLAILDVKMPNMDGYELAENLRASEATARVPIIFISAAYSDDDHIFKGYECGAVDFIIKPFGTRLLTSKVNTFLQLDREIVEGLRRSTERLTNIVDNSLDAIVLVDTNNIVRFLNPAAERLFHCDASELLGETLDFPMTAQTTEAELVRPDGSVSVSEMRVSEIEWEGEPCLLASLRDITERRQAEREISRLNEVLERRVEERTAQLEQANEELASFSFSVSHDLRAPLRVVDGFCRALEEKNSDQLDETGRDYLMRVRKGADKMNQLIDEILVLSRVTRTEISTQELDLSKLAEEVVFAIREARPDHDVAVTIAPSMPTRGDQGLLRQLLANLIGNAWKFTARESQPAIEVGCREEAEKTIYFVKDNGVGFDMAYADKLFRVFQRLHSAADFDGTGVGLATVRRIVQRHGGTIWARSKEGEGAEFMFTLGTVRAGVSSDPGKEVEA